MKQSTLLLLSGLFLLLSSCFHKSVMNDNADDVQATLLYTGKEGNYLLCHEQIFQATSKSSGGGMTHISGYTETRLSSYKLETGELAGRVSLGDQIDEGIALLGYSPGKIWMFGISDDLGLHYRDPVTLEVKESWESISQKPGLSALKPAPPTWAQIGQYYAFNWEAGKIMITDVEGFRYLLDPETFAIEKTEMEIPRMEWDDDASGSSGQFVKDQTYYLQGDTRKTISFSDKRSSNDVSFLFGEFYLDPDPAKESQRKKTLVTEMETAIKQLKDSLAAMELAHPGSTKEPDYSHYDNRQMMLHEQAEKARREKDDLEYKRKDLDGFHKVILDYPLLTGDKKSAFVRYASAINDTAHTVIARVNFAPDTTWSLGWSTHISSLYFDPDKADDKGVFETVYSKGNPDFDYTWAGTDGKFLVIVWQLRLTCLDMASGKVVWEKQI